MSLYALGASDEAAVELAPSFIPPSFPELALKLNTGWVPQNVFKEVSLLQDEVAVGTQCFLRLLVLPYFYCQFAVFKGFHNGIHTFLHPL